MCSTSIVPNVGVPTEIIEYGYNGLCVNVSNAKVVAGKIKEVFDFDNYARLTNNALTWFERFCQKHWISSIDSF